MREKILRKMKILGENAGRKQGTETRKLEKNADGSGNKTGNSMPLDASRNRTTCRAGQKLCKKKSRQAAGQIITGKRGKK